MQPPSASVLDSRAIVGLGERNLLLATGVLIMSANGATMEAFRESVVLWLVLFMFLSTAKKSEGYMGEQIINGIPTTLLTT